MPFSVWRSAGGHVRLAHAPTRRHDLGAVVAGDPVEEVEGLRVVAVGRLVDDEGGGGGVDGGQLPYRARPRRRPGAGRPARRRRARCGWGWTARNRPGRRRSRWRRTARTPRWRWTARSRCGPARRAGRGRRPRPAGSRCSVPPKAVLWAPAQAWGVPAWAMAAGLWVAVPDAAGRPGCRLRRPAVVAEVPAVPCLIMECSWTRPSRPTTPVTAPSREAGICGDAVLTIARADSPGACTDSSGRAQRGRDHRRRAADRQQRAARLGRADRQPLGCAGADETCATSAGLGPNCAAYCAAVR